MNAADLLPLVKLAPADLAAHLASIGDNTLIQPWIDAVFATAERDDPDNVTGLFDLAWACNDIAVELKQGNRPEAIRRSRYAGIYSLDYSDDKLIELAADSTGCAYWQHHTDDDLDLIGALIRAYDTLIEQGRDAVGHLKVALHDLRQVEIVAFEDLKNEETLDMGKSEPAGQGDHYVGEVQIINGADVRPEPIGWIWPGFLATGKVEILAGPAGVSKTTLAMALAAILTRAGTWPDGSRAQVGDVLVWSGEDDPADTLVPRLLAAGADMARVGFIATTTEADGQRRPFDPATDTQHLRRALAGRNVKLLIVDPIVSAVAGDSHKNGEVRRALQPLVDLAASIGCCVLGITHFSKGTQGSDPVERVTGSIAFGALARIVFACAKSSDDDISDGCDRLFVRSKSNIGPDGGGWRYALDQVPVPGHVGLYASRIRWGEALEGQARELLSRAEAAADPEERDALSDATTFLRDLLEDGPVGARQIKADGDAAGHAWRTLHRAADRLGVERKKAGMKGGWVWGLAPKMPNIPEDARKTEQEKLASSGHLGTFGGDAEEVEL